MGEGMRRVSEFAPGSLIANGECAGRLPIIGPLQDCQSFCTTLAVGIGWLQALVGSKP